MKKEKPIIVRGLTQSLLAGALSLTAVNALADRVQAQQYQSNQAPTAKLNLARDGGFFERSGGTLTQSIDQQTIDGNEYCVLPDTIHVFQGDEYGEYQVTDKHVAGFGAELCKKYNIELPATVLYYKDTLTVITSQSTTVYWRVDNYDDGVTGNRTILYKILKQDNN